MEEKFLSFEDVTKRYGCSRTTLYQKIRDGILPRGVKIGATRKFKLSELEAYEKNFVTA